MLLENAGESEATARCRPVAGFSRPSPCPISDHVVRISVSIGVAVDVGGHEVKADEVLRDADLAMYSAKSSHPGTFAVYEPSMHEDARSCRLAGERRNRPNKGTGRAARPPAREAADRPRAMKASPAAT